MYRDIAEKIKYHKEHIIASFVDKGIYPNDDMVKDLLDGIDSSMPYLYVEHAIKGEYFDTKKFNSMVQGAYRDLVLLYQLLHELSIKEFVALQAYVDTHLDDLQETVDYYKRKTEQEIGTTSLGQTVLFKAGNYNMKTKDNLTVIDLGSIALNKGSRIAGLFNANNIEGDKVTFALTNEFGKQRFSPYNYNQDTYLMPGALNRNEYEFEIDKDQVVRDSIKIGNVKAKEENKYIILGEKDKVLVKQFGKQVKQSIKNRPTKYDMLAFNEKVYIDFYTLNTKSVRFKFNKKPLSTNFSLDSFIVDELDYLHHFFIEADAGFAFEFEIEGGEVYAVNEIGIVDGEDLLFASDLDVRNFKIIEYETGDKVNCKMEVEIVNDDGDPVEVQSILIKELLGIGGTI